MNYTEFLSQGRAWSPEWAANSRGGFRWSVVLTPPGKTSIKSKEEYLDLLARRVDFHIGDWMERYADEMNVDPDDEAAVWRGTLALIESYNPELMLSKNMDLAQVSALIVRAIPDIPYANYPVECATDEKSRGLAECFRSEITFDGYLIEIFS